MGREVEASFDAEWLRQFTIDESDLATLVVPLVEAYSLDTSRLEEWLYYPVTNIGINPGGVLIQDTSLQPASPIKLMNYEEQNTIFIIGMLHGVLRLSPVDDVTTFFANKPYMYLSDIEGGHGFSWDGPDRSGLIYILVQGDALIGGITTWGFEAGSETAFLLAPTNVPDPRNHLHGERCSGGGISLLRSGVQAVALEGPANPEILLVDMPNGEQLGEYFEVTILSDRECIEGSNWWQAQTSDGIKGWIQENNGDTYLMSPRSGSSIPFYCPNVPQIRLIVGEDGTVLPDLGANNLRADPASDAPVLASIPPETTFTVMSGPVCADGFAWWQVDYEGTQGWTAEGQSDTYWLAPVFDDLTTDAR